MLRFKRISGAKGLTFFKCMEENRQPATGQIWPRTRDLGPVRIIFDSEEFVSKRSTILTEATVNYASSPVGLALQSATHKQFLNSELMVENALRYGEFHRVTGIVA